MSGRYGMSRRILRRVPDPTPGAQAAPVIVAPPEPVPPAAPPAPIAPTPAAPVPYESRKARRGRKHAN